MKIVQVIFYLNRFVSALPENTFLFRFSKTNLFFKSGGPACSSTSVTTLDVIRDTRVMSSAPGFNDHRVLRPGGCTTATENYGEWYHRFYCITSPR